MRRLDALPAGECLPPKLGGKLHAAEVVLCSAEAEFFAEVTVTVTTIDFMRRLQIERQCITMSRSRKTNKNGINIISVGILVSSPYTTVSQNRYFSGGAQVKRLYFPKELTHITSFCTVQTRMMHLQLRAECLPEWNTSQPTLDTLM
jgi:hypothetical protein